MLTISCQFSQTSFDLGTSILLPPSSSLLRTKPLLYRHSVKTSHNILRRFSIAPQDSKTHNLRAAKFHVLAYKLSLEINDDKVTIPTKNPF